MTKPFDKSELAEIKLSTVKAKMLWKHPFWATCALHLKPVEMSKEIVEFLDVIGLPTTMATDGIHLIYNPDFVLSLTDKELEFVLPHEILHCIHEHQLRRRGRNPQIWNESCDFAINPILVEAGIGKTPTKLLLDSQYSGRSAEEIYNMIFQQRKEEMEESSQQSENGEEGEDQDQNGEGNPKEDEKENKEEKKKPGDNKDKPGKQDKEGKDKQPNKEKKDNKKKQDKSSKNAKTKEAVGQCGAVVDSPANSGTDQQRSKWREIIIDAVNRAKAAGKLPAGMEKMVEDWIEPKAPWESTIAWWFQERFKDSYTWTKKNRRIRDVYLPGRSEEKKGRVVLAFDTSGSMWYTEDLFKRILGSISELLRMYKCEADLIDIDTEVSHHTHIESGDNIPLNYKPKGGGGTDFNPAFDWARENKQDDIDGLIYFTDLEGTFPDAPPSYNVLWVTWSENITTVPFGQLLKLPREIEKKK